MAFVNASLLVGGALVALPIILHLMMRQKPKRMIFPALQFVISRRESNRRTLRLRHWLLLLLRMLLILLLAAALARPSVDANHWGSWVLIGLVSLLLVIVVAGCIAGWLAARGPILVGLLLLAALLLATGDVVLIGRALDREGGAMLGDQEAPVAAALIIDSSSRMGYREGTVTRLEQAQQTARWLVTQLPRDSDVAVMGRAGRQQAFTIDVAAAGKAIERLKLSTVPRPLPDVIRDGLDLLAASNLERKELYVFTDLSEGAWPESAQLKQQLESQQDVLLYLIDVGVQNPTNVALSSIRLAEETLTTNGVFQLQVDIDNLGPAAQRELELLIEQPDPSLPIYLDGVQQLPSASPRGRQNIELAANGSSSAQFQLQGLSPGVHHGTVRLSGLDPLAVDNVRHFTVRVRHPWRVLVVAPENVPAKFLLEAISPYSLRQIGQAEYECTLARQPPGSDDWLAGEPLEDYAAVCLLNPYPLSEADWQSLLDFVNQGGGVGLFLGHNVELEGSFALPQARQLVGGQLLRQWRAEGRTFLSTGDQEHPILSSFRSIVTSVPWQDFPVYRYWQLAADNGVLPVLTYANSSHPALLEQKLGSGRALTMTTPISEAYQIAGRQPWNDLVSGENAWPYFVLINGGLRWLVSGGESSLNYLAGDTAELDNDEGQFEQSYQLFAPEGEPQPVTAVNQKVTIRFTEQLGSYRLKSESEQPVLRGFSVNGHASQSRLARIAPSQLDQRLGEERYQLARSRSEIQFGVRRKRLGQEFFPLLIGLVALVLALEYVMANRFYGRNSMATDTALESGPLETA